MAAIIKAAPAAASESGGQKGNKTSKIRGQPPGCQGQMTCSGSEPNVGHVPCSPVSSDKNRDHRRRRVK